MPTLGADMGEGTLQEWRVQLGDLVHKGDPVAVDEGPAEGDASIAFGGERVLRGLGGVEACGAGCSGCGRARAP